MKGTQIIPISLPVSRAYFRVPINVTWSSTATGRAFSIVLHLFIFHPHSYKPFLPR